MDQPFEPPRRVADEEGGDAMVLQDLESGGGQLSHARTHGLGLIHEAVVQLRGEGEQRQVPGARVGVVSTGGLTPSGVMLLRADS